MVWFLKYIREEHSSVSHLSLFCVVYLLRLMVWYLIGLEHCGSGPYDQHEWWNDRDDNEAEEILLGLKTGYRVRNCKYEKRN